MLHHLVHGYLHCKSCSPQQAGQVLTWPLSACQVKTLFCNRRQAACCIRLAVSTHNQRPHT